MKRSELPQRGDMIYMTGPMQPVMGVPFEPTALQMRVDLMKAQIAEYTPTPAEREYQRRLRESAHLRKSFGHR